MKYIKIIMEENEWFFNLSTVDYVCVTKNGKKKIMFNDGETIKAERFEIVDDKYLNEIDSVETFHNETKFRSLEAFKILEHLCHKEGLNFDLFYNRVCEWNIKITDACFDTIFESDDCDLDYLLAKAQVATKDWLLEHREGY